MPGAVRFGEFPPTLSLDRWSPDEALSVLNAVRRSGLSIPDFASRHGLKVQRLYWWRRRLTESETPPLFAEVSVGAPLAVPPAKCTGSGLALQLSNGRVVRIEREFDEISLRRLLRVLDGDASC